MLYKVVSKSIPWPLGAFDNRRSFTSIDNLCFVIDRLISENSRPGVYHIADDEPLSTNELISGHLRNHGTQGSNMVSAAKADEWRSMDRWFIRDKAHAGIGKRGIKKNGRVVSKISELYWFKIIFEIDFNLNRNTVSLWCK